MKRPQFNSWVGKIHWRRDRLPPPVFLGFPCGSAGKESACNAGRPGFDPWVGKIPWRRERLPCLLRTSYAGQEARVRTEHGTTDWFQIGKGIRQGCILSPCLFNFYAEYIMRNAGLEEAQAGIKITGRNINNLRYANDTTLMAEREEELKSLLMQVKRGVKKLA